MLENLRENTFFYFLVSGIITWLIFLLSFLLLTRGLMYVMELEGIALLFLVVGIFCLVLNYFFLKKLFSLAPYDALQENKPIYNYHQIISSLERVFRVIIILTSLGLFVSLLTFFLISMEYFMTHSIEAIVDLLPFMFITYLLFIIPSFYGLKEINQIKSFLNEFDVIKSQIKTSLQPN